MKRLLLAAYAVLCADAQTFSFGAKAGSPVNDPIPQIFGSARSSARWTGGPTFELHLPKRFSIEADALFRSDRSSYSAFFRTGPDTGPFHSISTGKTNTWDFPVLLKYHINDRPIRPFVSAGIQVSRSSVSAFSAVNCLGTREACTPSDPNLTPRGGTFEFTHARSGPVVGAGFDFKANFVTIAPEVRVSAVDGVRHSKQVTAMVGFTFKRKR